jgi:hypothetical protein
MFEVAQLKEVHRYSARHRRMLESAVLCGCFYCGAIFPAGEIDLWCDDAEEGVSGTLGTTALCPRCGIDSVIPDNIPAVPLNVELLTAMREYFF